MTQFKWGLVTALWLIVLAFSIGQLSIYYY